MFGLFKKKKLEFDDTNIKREILECVDWYLDEIYKNNINKKKALLDVRSEIQAAKLTEDVGNHILIILKNYKSNQINEETIVLIKEKVETTMFKLFKRKKETKIVDVVNENQKMIDTLMLEIRQCVIELNTLDGKIEHALKTNQKMLWHSYTQQKRTLEAKVDLKNKSLNDLLIKQSNKELDEETKKRQEITEHLQSKDNYVDAGAVQGRIEESNIVSGEVETENENILNAVNSNNAFDDDFDKAREEYLLNQNKESSSEEDQTGTEEN